MQCYTKYILRTRGQKTTELSQSLRDSVTLHSLRTESQFPGFPLFRQSKAVVNQHSTQSEWQADKVCHELIKTGIVSVANNGSTYPVHCTDVAPLLVTNLRFIHRRLFLSFSCLPIELRQQKPLLNSAYDLFLLSYL